MNTTGFGIGSGAFKEQMALALPDSGTSLALLPAAVVEEYYAQVKSAYIDTDVGFYLYNCTDSLPNFTFGVGDTRFEVLGSNLNFEAAGGGLCLPGIQSQGSSPLSILGDAFLQSFYVVYDMGPKPRIGWAKKQL